MIEIWARGVGFKEEKSIQIKNMRARYDLNIIIIVIPVRHCNIVQHMRLNCFMYEQFDGTEYIICPCRVVVVNIRII